MIIKNKNMIGIICLVFFFGGVYNVFLNPQGQRLRAIRGQYLSEKKLLETRNEMKKNISLRKNDNVNLYRKLESVEDIFLADSEVHSFLNNLSNIAVLAECELKTVDPLTNNKDETTEIKEERVKIVISGRYGSIKDFIKEIQETGKMIKISNLKIKSIDENTTKVNASFVLILYVDMQENIA